MAAVAALGAACSCFVFIAFLNRRLQRQPIGRDIGVPKLDALALQVKSGSRAFLKEEYKYLVVFVSTLAVVLAILYATNPVSGTREEAWVASGSRGMLGKMSSQECLEVPIH